MRAAFQTRSPSSLKTGLRLAREMVKLLYSALYTQPAAGGEPVVLTAASELSSFGYFQRGR